MGSFFCRRPSSSSRRATTTGRSVVATILILVFVVVATKVDPCRAFSTTATSRTSSWGTTALRMSDGPAASSPAASSSPSPSPSTNKQKEYGSSLPYPDTYVRCGRCGTSYALKAEDLGDRGKGRRVECSACGHSWYQSRDRLFDVRDGFEFHPLPAFELDRIASNVKAGRPADFVGDAKLYVGNLDFAITEEELRLKFVEEAKCEVGSVSLVMDDRGRSRGFAFVTAMTKEDGERAKEVLDGYEWNGRNMNVREPNN